jgi:hypothetical protein
MAEDILSRFFTGIDIAAKLVTAAAIPVIGIVVDNHLKTQTTRFEQLMTTRERNINLSLKFYEVIASKRFECYDESKRPLLKIFLDTNNTYNDVKIPFEDVAGSLIKTSLTDPNCYKIADDTAVAKEKNNKQVPIVVSSAAPDAAKKNETVKKTVAAVADTINKTAPHAEKEPGDGWVAVGRPHTDADGHSAKLDFSNFAVIGAAQSKPLSAGMVLKTKTAMPLRYSTDDTGLGPNHILAMLSRGTCVSVTRVIPDLRSQTWARVDIEPSCPRDDDSHQRASLKTSDG